MLTTGLQKKNGRTFTKMRWSLINLAAGWVCVLITLFTSGTVDYYASGAAMAFFSSNVLTWIINREWNSNGT